MMIKAGCTGMLKRNDIVLAVLLIALAVCGLFAARFFTKGGSRIAVYSQNIKIAEASLNENQTIPIPGEYPSTLQIFNGEARVVEAACPDKLCKNHAPVKNAGELIVCIPNQSYIEVLGEADDEIFKMKDAP